jgi:hypothetical protein
MYRLQDIRRFLSLAVLIGIFGCSDLGTVPESVVETDEATPFFLRAPLPGMDVLRKRTRPGGPRSRETTGTTVSKRIGDKGGVIEFNDLGVRIIFPRGALSERTRITADVFGGSAVAFEFAPHGLTFRVPVEIRIDRGSPLLSRYEGFEDGGGEAHYALGDLVGVYFLGNPATGVTPLETLPMYVDGTEVVLEISHFSGYAVASD